MFSILDFVNFNITCYKKSLHECFVSYNVLRIEEYIY